MTPHNKTLKTLKTVLLACALACGAVQAQTYPDKPITLVVPFAAGGPTDVVARMIAIPMGTSTTWPMYSKSLSGSKDSFLYKAGAVAMPMW